MKWYEFASLTAGQRLSPELTDTLLWGQTCYPFGDLRITVRQLRSAIRAWKNGTRRCELCGWKLPYHIRGCLQNVAAKER